MTGTSLAAPVLHRVKVKPFKGYDGTVRHHADCEVCRFSTLRDTPAEAQAAAASHATPALEFLLDTSDRPFWDYGPDSFCPECPFRDPELSYQEREGSYIDNDPTEAHYDCRLLGKKVWGEYSPCEEKDWRGQARRELDALLRPQP